MIHIVLENPSHPGNIGAVARAMYTMGFHDLTMLNPCEINDESIMRARKASKVLEHATILKSTDELVSTFDLLIGTSSRSRALHLPVISAQHIPNHLFNPEKKIGIVFGHEKNGLSNELMNLCSAIIEIPTFDQMSLNLSHAVQTICYELSKIKYDSNDDFSSASEREALLSWLKERVDPDFMKPHTTIRLRSIFNKSLLTKKEVNLLYSLFSSIK